MRPNGSKLVEFISSWIALGSMVTPIWLPTSVSNLKLPPPWSLMRAKPSHLAVGRLGAARVTAAASTIACVLCLVHFAATRPLGLLVQPAPVMGLAVAMALFSTVLPVWMVSEAIRRLGAGPVSLIGTLGPVVTLFLGWLILAEPIGVYQLVGGALVIAGVLLVGSKR